MRFFLIFEHIERMWIWGLVEEIINCAFGMKYEIIY